MLARILTLVAVGVAVVWLFKKFARDRSLFAIVVTDAGIEIKGRIPTKQHREVREFIRSLRLPIGAQITGYDKGRTDFRMRFSGNIDDESCQRVRSFLYH